MSTASDLEIARTLIAELEWTIELLGDDGGVPERLLYGLFADADSPRRLGRYAAAAQLDQLDLLLSGLREQQPVPVSRAQAQAIAGALHKATDAHVAMLTPREQESLTAACLRRTQALRRAADSEMTVPPEEVEVEFIVLLAPDITHDDAQRIASAAEATLGDVGEFVGYEFHGPLHRLTISVAGFAADALVSAVLQPLRPHAGSGSHYTVRGVEGGLTRHDI